MIIFSPCSPRMTKCDNSGKRRQLFKHLQMEEGGLTNGAEFEPRIPIIGVCNDYHPSGVDVRFAENLFA